MQSTSSKPQLPQPHAPPALHRFSLGRPANRVFQTIRTDHAPARERYEYWTDALVRNLQADAPNDAQRQDFYGHVVSLATLTKEIHFSQSDGFSGVRTAQAIRADQSSELSLLYVVEGRLAASLDKESIVATAGDFYLYDSRLVQRLAISRHRLIQVDLPRLAFETTFAGKTPSPALVTKALASSRLTPLLRTQLDYFPQMAAAMSPVEQQDMLEMTEALALSILHGAIGNLLPPDDNRDKAFLLAAQRYIQRNLDKPDLSPAEIAFSIGCSRATLYRVFKRHGLTVAGYIRELRLQQLFRLLQNACDRRPIAVLAQLCGLYDTPNVNQMFRRRFGANPSGVRASRPRS